MLKGLQLPYHPTRWQKLAQRLLAARPVSAFIAPIANTLDAPIIRLSAGKTSLTTLLTGLPYVTLTSIGAKSGLPRSVLLLAFPLDEGEQQDSPEAGGKVILIASNFGRAQHPAWYYNLKANPHATLSLGDHAWEYLAHETVGEERETCWRRAVSFYGGYNAYRQRASPAKGGASHRTIGVFVLSPAAGQAPAAVVDSSTVSPMEKPQVIEPD